MADLRIVDAPLLSTIKGTEKIPTGGEGNFSVSVNQVADFAKLKWVLATEGYVDNAVGNVQSDLNLHKNNESNPHNVTKTQVGLGNVDNTADLDKPVSNAGVAALNMKADKQTTYTKTEANSLLSTINSDIEEIISAGGLKRYDGKYYFDQAFATAIGGYPLNSKIILTNGDTVKSTIENNNTDPNVNLTGWVKTNSTSQIFDANKRSQQEINDDYVNVKKYGAIGDNTLHNVSEWTVTGSRIYYPNLAAIQVDYPHVTSLSDSIDWAAIQKALDTDRDVVGPSAHYHINKSLYMKRTHQKFKDLGIIHMDAGIAKPCLYLGAKDTNGTKSDVQVWFSEISGTAFHGFGNRSEGSAGLSLVSCSQCKISIDARGFHAGVRVDGVCIVNTFFQPILLQNTYGLYDPLGHPTISDIQASAFFGGRIEKNEREGVYSASPNIKFIGTCVEGNGKFNGSDGSTPEVTILAGPTSGAVTFADCYMESLAGKSSQSAIAIAPNASRFLFITGGEYFGSLDNNKYVVDILSPASVECGVFITQALVSNFINYVRGTISGNSRVSVINNFPKADMSIFSSVNVGIGLPLIQQIDRAYHRTNQNVRALSFSSDSGITTITLTASGLVTADYFLSKNPVIGLTLYNYKFTKRNRTPSAAVTRYTCIPLSEIESAVVYMFKIMAVQRMSSNAGRAFEANLFVTGNGGSPTIQNSQILWNTDSNLIPTFSVDATGVVVSNLSTAGLYDFEVTKFGRS